LRTSGVAVAEPDFEELRRREFGRLDANGVTYLDYTGAALYPASLISVDASRLMTSVCGNPHSESAPSLASSCAIDTARRLTLQFFNADPHEYDVVFTHNATGAIRIVAEAFPFREGSRLVLTADNHNSVNGLRLPAEKHGAAVDYVPLDSELRPQDPTAWLTPALAPSLFAFPALSNFSGVRHPLNWVDEAQRLGYHVLLDAAALVSTCPLSLSKVHPDFVAFSFYKMFGYPTGIGALIVRRSALAQLRRTYFGGGTVEFVSVRDRVSRIKEGVEGFEDGTPNFLAMAAVADGLRWLTDVGIERVKQRVTMLTAELLDRLNDLETQVEIYGPRNTTDRGGVVAFNVCVDGRILHYSDVLAFARDRGVAVRGGCFCNPGAAERCLPDGVVGAVRASVGIPTTTADLDRLVEVILDLTKKMGS
jgi:selenocysteine lyase/cysteine desulfurase